MGKGSNAIPSRQLIRHDLDQRYTKMMVENKKKIQLTIYKDKIDYYFHFKIPSESNRRENTYDVVLKFMLDDDIKEVENDKNLNRYYLQFFSNSPSFTYTFAYAFNFHDMLIQTLTKKYESVVLKQLPMTRNPAEIISYEKSIYFACHYLLRDRRYLDKEFIKRLAKPYNATTLQRVVRNTDQIKLEIKKEDNRIKQEKEELKKQESRSNSHKPRGSQLQTKKVSPSTTRSKLTTRNSKGKVVGRKSSVNKIKPR